MRRSLRQAAGCLAACLAGVSHAQFDNSTSLASPDNPFDRAVTNPIRDNAAPRILQGASRAGAREPESTRDAQTGVLQSGSLASWPRLYRDDALIVSGTLTGTLGLFEMWNNVFDVPPASAAPTYRRNPGWGEFFIEPGLTGRYTLDPAAQLYGGVAYMETATRGIDSTGAGSTTHGDLEQLYAGLRIGRQGSGPVLDASYGRQDFTVGSSMLIAAGASNGGQRGADYLGPRAAWSNAGLLKLNWGDWNIQGFWLKPNDASAAATGTRLAGVNVEWLNPGPVRAAAMYVYVPASDIVTRDGLNVYDVRARVHPVTAAPTFWIQAEYAWQRKGGVAADGWYVQLNYNALETAWKPLVSVQYASFSGDKPGTAKWEGFDSLYFGGSNPDWYQGKIGSTIFNNTNLDSVAVSLTLTPDAKTIVQLLYLYFAAAQTDSPLAVPSPGVPPATGGGVPARSLAGELDAVYTYTFSKYLNVNAFVAYAAPGSGYKALYAGQGGAARDWWAIGTQLNFSY